jgi:hypothetical protein
MRQIVLVFVTVLLSCASAHAEYGLVKSDGYRIPLGEAVQQIAPFEWRVMFEDNTLRSYQVSWSKGKRWGEVLDELGSQYDIAFLGDARNKTLYCANTKELVSRGFTLVGTDYEAEKYNLKAIAYRATSETEAMADITTRVRDGKTNLVDIEYSVNQKLRDYESQKSQLLAAESTAIAMGLPSDKEFVSIVTEDYKVVPIKVIAVDPNDKYKLLNSGDLLNSANEYFSKRWKFNVYLRADSEDLKVSIPFTLKMPSESLTNDIKSFSKSINTPENPVAVYFKVFKNQQYSDGLGAIEVRYQRKNKDQ